MLMIERRGEHYLVHFLQTDNRFSAFAFPSQSFPDIQSLTGFLRHTLPVPQALVDEALETGSLGLTREHIDWQNHRLMIYGKGGIYGTKSKRRIIPLTDRIRPLIDGHFAIHDTIGMAPRTIQRILKRIANKARINRPVCPHVLRHTFAVAAVQKGISLPALQRLLGHDRLTTTEIYLNLSPEDVIREFREKW